MSESAVFSKCAWRLIPFLGLLYVANFLDRVNVGFAALTMNADIGLTAETYGIGAGMFFIGYFFFEVPSNLAMEKFGARLWMFRIMLTWGLVSMATAFVKGPVGFFVARFLLGACEAGFFPGVILYLTYWFPAATRGQFNALFLSAIMVANIIGAPVSGYILHATDGIAGLRNWQWLFLIEGLPSIVLGFVTLLYLPSKPADAAWLSEAEKETIHTALARDDIPHGKLRDCFADLRIWVLAVADFGIVLAIYGLGLWLPQMVKAQGFDDLQTGFVVAVPYLATMIGMIAWARVSDRRGERIRCVILPSLLAAASLTAAALLGGSLWTVLALTLATMGIYAAIAVFWALPQSFLGGTAAAAAIALVNSVANLGGFLGPTIVGYLKDATGGYAAAMGALAAGLLMTVVVIAAVSRSISSTKPAAVLSWLGYPRRRVGMRVFACCLTFVASVAIAGIASATPNYPKGALELEQKLLAQQSADTKAWIKDEGEHEASGQFLSSETARNAARKFGVSGSQVSTLAFLVLMEAARVADNNVYALAVNAQAANASRADARQAALTSTGIASAQQAQLSGGLQSAQQNQGSAFVPLASTEGSNPVAQARATSAAIPPPSMTLQDAMDRESQIEDLLAGAMKNVGQSG